MTTNFERIMQGLREVVEIEAGRADPYTYRVHVPDPVTGGMVHVPGMRIGPPPPKALSERAISALSERRRRRRQRTTQTALFDELYGRRYGATSKALSVPQTGVHAAE